jgi:hypothetical protein
MAIKITSQKSPDSTHSTIAATFDESVAMDVSYAILAKIAGLIAERYVEQNYAAIIAKLDQAAIANLAIADAAKKIAEEIRVKPTVIEVPRPRLVGRYW